MIHDHTYESGIFVESDHVVIGYTGYDEYPIRSWECDDYFVIQEGMIYNIPRSGVDSFVSNLVSQNRKSSISIEDAKKFLFESDGEFVIVIYDKLSEDVIIINDALGRLPLYCFKDDQQFVISREVKFITEFMSNVNLDKLAVAEYLLLRYPLGKRTLVENVDRLDPAVLLKWQVSSGRLTVKKVHVWNFEDKFPRGGTTQEYVYNLVKLFRDATRCRVESLKGVKNLVSLSGGLDSRAAAAALREVDSKSTAVTFLDYEGKSSKDVDVASEVVQQLHMDWQLIKLKKRSFEDLRRLIELKDGLNSVAMGYILDFLVKIRRKFGSKVICYTGQGGDKTLHSMRPVKEVESMEELIDMILAEGPAHARAFGIDEVMKLSTLSMEQIRRAIMDVLLSYPENDLNYKYVHYVFERGYKLMFEAEDRDRFYIWSTSPFWALSFFNYASKIPDNCKAHFNLYRMFLERLNKKCLKVRYANWPRVGFLPGSLSYYLFPRIQEILTRYYSSLPKMIQNIVQISKEDKKYNANEKIENYQQIYVPSYLREFMSL
jgi:asparagine synthase (glutamine-hydrolysing)